MAAVGWRLPRVVMDKPPPPQPQSTSTSTPPPPPPPHGIKRPKDDVFDETEQQRLSKRFHCMNIATSSKIIKNTSNNGTTCLSSHPPRTPHLTPLSRPGAHHGGRPPLSHHRDPQPRTDSNLMQIEETPHRIFIHSLDDELAESDDERPIFLSDIEKHLLKLPKAVLLNESDRNIHNDMQLVLYRVPESLSVPREQDNVRKAIIESRRRMANLHAGSHSAAQEMSVDEVQLDSVSRDGVQDIIRDDGGNSMAIDVPLVGTDTHMNGMNGMNGMNMMQEYLPDLDPDAMDLS